MEQSNLETGKREMKNTVQSMRKVCSHDDMNPLGEHLFFGEFETSKAICVSQTTFVEERKKERACATNNNLFLSLCNNIRQIIYSFIEAPAVTSLEEAEKYNSIMPSFKVKLYFCNYSREKLMSDYLSLVQQHRSSRSRLPRLAIMFSEVELVLATKLTTMNMGILEEVVLYMEHCSNSDFLVSLWNALEGNVSIKSMELVIGMCARNVWNAKVSESFKTAIENNSTLQSLKMYHMDNENGIWAKEMEDIYTSEWISSLGAALKQNSTLKTLALEVLRNDFDAVHEIAKSANSLTDFHIINYFGDNLSRHIGTVLKNNNTLRRLTVASGLEHESIISIGRSLSVNHVLTHLDINRKYARRGLALDIIGGSTSIVLLFQGLSTNESLRVLRLQGFSIGIKGTESVAHCLRVNTSLRELYLENCFWKRDLFETGYKKIAQVISSKPSLRVLSFKYSFHNERTWSLSSKTLNALANNKSKCLFQYTTNRDGLCCLPVCYIRS